MIVPALAAFLFVAWQAFSALDAYATSSPPAHVPAGWVRTTGSVVGDRGGRAGKITYQRPVVAFVDRSGTHHAFTAAGDSRGSIKKGTVATVAYDPAAPSQAVYVNEPGSLRTGALVLGTIFGVLAVGVGAFDLWLLWALFRR